MAMKTDKELRLTLGGIQIDAMLGDNLAIELCGTFEDRKEPITDESGWGPTALAGCNATLDAIHAHYMPTITELRAQLAHANNVIISEQNARAKGENALRAKDHAMGTLFGRLRTAGVDYSDLIP